MKCNLQKMRGYFFCVQSFAFDLNPPLNIIVFTQADYGQTRNP